MGDREGKIFTTAAGLASLRKAVSVWWFLIKAPCFLYWTHFCLGFSAVLRLWEEEQPQGMTQTGQWLTVELAHRPAAAWQHRAGGWMQAAARLEGSQHALLTSNPNKGCSDFFLAAFNTFSAKKCPKCLPASIWLILPSTWVIRLSLGIAGKGSIPAFMW